MKGKDEEEEEEKGEENEKEKDEEEQGHLLSIVHNEYLTVGIISVSKSTQRKMRRKTMMTMQN